MFRIDSNRNTSVTFEEALVVLNDLVVHARSADLTEPEIIILRGAWEDREYNAIAENSEFTTNYLQRGVAPRLWDFLTSIIGNGQRVDKRRLKDFLAPIALKYYAKSRNTPADENSLLIQGGQPPKAAYFFGRSKELLQLKEVVIKQQCIVMYGVSGVGKTALAAKLMSEISQKYQSNFECLIWKSVFYSPKVEDLVLELLDLLQPERSEDLPQYTQGLITVLLKQLRSRRCLIVLDAIEALFPKSNLEQQREYGTFLRRLAEERHQSCVVLTSQGLPSEIGHLIQRKVPILDLKIQGLEAEDAMLLLRAYQLTDETRCKHLIKTYRGNPLHLEDVIDQIHRYFGGDIEKYLHSSLYVNTQFKTTFKQTGQSLSSIEQQIMIYLARVSDLESVSFNQILSELQKQKISVSVSELIDALRVLEQNCLIEDNERERNETTHPKQISYGLQPIIKKAIRLTQAREPMWFSA